MTEAGAGGATFTEPDPVDPAPLTCPDCPWSQVEDMPLHVRSQAVVEYDGALLLFGGYSYENDIAHSESEAPFSIVMKYDRNLDEWSRLSSMPAGSYLLSAHAIGGQIYVFIGQDVEELVQIYDPASDSWSQGPAIPLPRYDASSAVVNGKVYLAGGTSMMSRDTSDYPERHRLDIFDPQHGWSRGSDLPTDVSGAATCAIDGRVYLFGGDLSDATYIYDVASDSWSEGAPSPVSRSGHTCVRVGSSLLVMGGHDADDPPLDVVEEYEVATDTWHSRAPLNVARQWFGAAAAGPAVYVFGGQGPSSDPLDLLNQAEMLGLGMPPY